MLVADSPNTQVIHNSILLSGTYANAIEYRFAGASGVMVANNAMDARVAARDGATGTASGNYTTASTALFVDAPAGDLHLKVTSIALIDKVASPLSAAATDWDGDVRPAGATDIGADEYTGSAGTPPTAPRNIRLIIR